MKLRTIVTLELSNICNLACSYCVNRLIVNGGGRIRKIMDDETFEASLFVIGHLVDEGTQGVINLNGNGESLLDKALPQRVAAVREVVGKSNRIQLCTNGLALTRQLAKELAEAGIDSVDVSIHRPDVTRRVVEYLSEFGIMGVISAGAVGSTHNWAGQLEDENSVKAVSKIRCDAIPGGWGYIQAEGSISVCCYDYRGLSTIGTVFDDDIFERELKPFSLCKTCHQVLPKAFRHGFQDEVTACNR